MLLKRKFMWVSFAWVFLASTGFCHFTVSAQSTQLRTAPINATYRGTAISSTQGVIFATDYVGSTVLKIDASTLQPVATLPVDKGPTQLAISHDGRVLACLNTLANKVSLIELATFTVYRTINVDAGPNAIAAIPGGGFAVTHGFGDSLYLIDHVTGAVAAEMKNLPGVPNGVAASDRAMAVSLRAPNALLLYGRDSTVPVAQIPLASPPVAVTAMSNGVFAVATHENLIGFDGNGQTLNQIPGDYQALAAFGEGVAAIQENELHFFDGNLSLIRTLPLNSSGARSVSADQPLLAVVASTSKTLEVLGTSTTTTSTPPTPLEPAPVLESVDITPEKAAETPKLEIAQAPEIEEKAPKKSPPRVKIEVPAIAERKKSSKKAQGEGQTVSRVPRRQPDSKTKLTSRFAERPGRASIMGVRPHAPKLGDKTNEAFMEDLRQGMTMEGEGSLLGLDWTQDLTDIQSQGDAEIDLETEVSVFRDGVDFHIDEALGHAETVIIDQKNGIADLERNVSVSTETSRLEADRIHIEWASSAEEQSELPIDIESPIHPLVPLGWEPRDPSQGLAEGIVEAVNVKLDEPTRFLITDQLDLDLHTHQGEMTNVQGRTGPIYFNAKKLRILGPADALGEDVWVTTCDHEVPHYRIRLSQAEVREGKAIMGTNARLQLGKIDTPLVVPRLKSKDIYDENRIRLDFDSGHQADVGYFVNYAQWYRATDNLDLGFRLYPTTQEGVGFGLDGEYDFMDDPTSPFFRSSGAFQTMYTTEDRGYNQFYHRQELSPNTVILGQWEQWYDRDFVKDFYNDIYEDRTGPRTFLNIAHTKPGYIAELTASKSTHDFVREAEKLPEAAFHLLERQLVGNFYFTLDAATGYYLRNPNDYESARSIAVARLSYDWNLASGINILPFVEADGTRYSTTLDDGDDDTRFTGTSGVTVQTRFQRAYRGRGRFSGFKHVIVPSVTYSYREQPGLDAEDTPRFDDLDDRPGRSRIESKIDNIILGRNAETGEVWRVARLSLFQGNDFWNETSEADDYETDFEIRPRPWWGLRTIGEHHSIDEEPGDPNVDFNRVLAFLFYDNSRGKNNMNWRLGFALTEVDGMAINREVLYGMGYRISPKWAVAAEHRYDLERSELTRQSYEIRRRLHRWEMGLRFLERDSGVDVRIEFSLIDFPGASLRF